MTNRLQPVIDAAGFSALARGFVALHRQHPPSKLIRNVDATVECIETDGIALPATVSQMDHADADRPQAWICSPLSTYSHYASEELQRLHKPALQAAVSPLLRGSDRLMRRARIDDCVAVNNWLVSTNSYPDVATAAITRLADQCRTRWPDRSIWFRSLNFRHNRAWIDALQSAGAILVPSRQVYLFHDIARHAKHHADLKKDLSLLKRARVQRLAPDGLQASDYARAADLYAQLYLGKYSTLNPDYTPALLRHWHAAGWLDLHGLRSDAGELVAVVGMLRFGNLVTSPIVGYDTTRPVREGLYRLMAATVLDQAMQRGDIVNLSAGVSHFKRQRGGEPAIEYSAVIADHLPRSRRAVLSVLGGLTRHVGVPLMRHYRL